jgi:hypothetical protein
MRGCERFDRYTGVFAHHKRFVLFYSFPPTQRVRTPQTLENKEEAGSTSVPCFEANLHMHAAFATAVLHAAETRRI